MLKNGKTTPLHAEIRAGFQLYYQGKVERQAEERRIQRLIANGIDPATGQRIAPPAALPQTPPAPHEEHRISPVPVKKQPWIAPPMIRAQQIAVLELRQAGVGRDEAVAAVLNDPRFHRGVGEERVWVANH